MGWMSGPLAAACLAVALLHLLRLAVRRRDVAVELSHAAMGLGMAAMFSPLGDPVPAPAWTAVFVVCTAWFAVDVLRTRSLAGDGGHHVISSGAMLFMLAAGHGAADPAGGAAHAGHAAHGGGATTLGIASAVSIVLAGYFAWHALRCVDRCRRPEPGPAAGAAIALRAPARSLHTPQVAAGAHLVMAVAMAAMLLGTV